MASISSSPAASADLREEGETAPGHESAPESIPELTGRRRGRGGVRRQRLAEQRLLPNGLPAWAGLSPVLIFLLLPLTLALAITITGGNWEPEVLYPIAALMGVYVAASAFRGVELILACMLFYLPFSSTYVIPLAPGVNGTNMLILLGLAASVIRMADRRQGWIGWPPGTALVIIFGVVTSLSGLTTIFTLPGGYGLLLYNEILSYKAWIDQFIFYFIVLSCIRDTATAKRMLVYMAIGAMAVALHTIPEMIDKYGLATIEKSRLDGPHRQSNNFGGFMAYTALPLISVFMMFIRDVRVWLFTPYFLLVAKILISTFSRGAYLAIAAGGLLAGYLRGKAFLFVWVCMGTGFFLVFPQFIPEAITVRMQSLTERSTGGAIQGVEEKLDKSSEHRLVLWRAAARMIIEDPVIGKGFKAFPALKGQYTEINVHESDPHNMYLYIASQMGLPALILFLMVMIYGFWLGRSLSRRGPDRYTRAIGAGGAAAVACYAVICLFGSRAVNLEFTAYFWTLLVMLQVLHKAMVDGEQPVTIAAAAGADGGGSGAGLEPIQQDRLQAGQRTGRRAGLRTRTNAFQERARSLHDPGSDSGAEKAPGDAPVADSAVRVGPGATVLRESAWRRLRKRHAGSMAARRSERRNRRGGF